MLTMLHGTCRRWVAFAPRVLLAGRQRSGLVLPQASMARAVRPVPLQIITVAKGNSPGARLMAAEWVDKLRRCAGGPRSAGWPRRYVSPHSV